jgi:arylformamidase
LRSIVDLTHTLYTGMPTYPGDEPSPEITSTPSKIAANIQTSTIRLGSHFGTHIDAPLHFLPNSKGLMDFPIDSFAGQAICLNKRNYENSPIDLTPKECSSIRQSSPDWVLIYTGFDENWGRPEYFSRHPFLSHALCRFIIDTSITGIGIDFPSIDAADAAEANFPIHHLILNAGLLVLENLTNLGKLPLDRTFEFYALPLKTETEAAPARVVAVL